MIYTWITALTMVFLLAGCAAPEGQESAESPDPASAREDSRSQFFMTQSANGISITINNLSLAQYKAAMQPARTQNKPQGQYEEDNNRKVNACYQVPLSTGYTLHLCDSLEPVDDLNYRSYEYMATFPQHNFLLFSVVEHEYYSHQLVHLNSGHTTEIWGDPIFSPDYTYFLSPSFDMEAYYLPNGLQLWRLTQDGAELLLEIDNTENEVWGVTDGIWLNDHEAVFKRTWLDNDLRPNEAYSKLMIGVE